MTDGERYIRRIRNYDKRRYAWAYRDYLRAFTTAEPPRPESLSVMAAQAVRLELKSLLPLGRL